MVFAFVGGEKLFGYLTCLQQVNECTPIYFHDVALKICDEIGSFIRMKVL